MNRPVPSTPTPVPRAPATRPARTIRLMRPPGPEGVAMICVSVGEESTVYSVMEIPCEIGGRGFVVHKTGLGTLYHVRVSNNPVDCSCECNGFLYRTYCRHILGLLALIGEGKL